MKLKLETHESVTILVVTEAITAQEGQILRAGVGKLIESGKTPVVIDLTAAQITDPIAAADVAALPGWAFERKAQALIASTDSKLGQAPTRAEAIALLKSPSAELLARETLLVARQASLQKQKADLERQLGAMGAGSDPKTIRQESSEMLRAIRVMREEIALLTQAPDGTPSPTAPFVSEGITARRQTLHKTLVGILSQQGVLPK